jgi:hypothetical protein
MKWIMKAILIVLCAAEADFSLAQDKPWLHPMTDWSAEDVNRILSDSPWAQKQDEVLVDPFYRMKAQGPKFQIIYRFLSARPIRKALYRSIELNRRSTQADIEAARAFMNRKYDDIIVISVSFANPQYPYQVDLKFSKPTTALLRNNTYITLSSGRRQFLREYQAPGEDGLGARFIFSRLVDGMPFIRPEERIIRFDSERLDIHNIQFKIADMMLDGVLEY